jgi:microcystin-dependent protein
LQNYALGQVGGVESITLTVAQLPAHSHAIRANSGDPNDSSPANSFPSGGGSYNSAANASMNPGMDAPAGGGQPHENREPYLVLNWIIALEGIYPSRS